MNLALCCLGVLPGVLHAWYIIATTPDPTYTQVPQDEESGHVTYYYVQAQPQYRPGGAPAAQGKLLGKPAGYGTVSNTPNAQFPSQSAGFVEPPAPSTESQAQAGPSGEVAAPPTYQQAVGDHKVQRP